MEPNQQNKQVSNKRTRDMEKKEQTDRDQRGVGRGLRGKEGEGSSRNMYKGPMDKGNSGEH